MLFCRRLQKLRLGGVGGYSTNARKDVARAALALEECIPGLEISEVDYEGAADDLAEESRLAAHPRVFEDARGNLLAIDDNGHEYPIGGKALDLEVCFF